jgi:hypothetical protein
MPISRIFAIAAIAVTACLSTAATAGAATRYAAPGSSVTTGACANPVPGCRLDYAINAAPANDTVIVLTGDYTVTWPIQATQLVHVQGEAGQPRPRLLGDAALAGATVNLPKGGSFKHFYVESKSASSALSTKGVAVTDAIAYATSSDAAEAKTGSGSVIRDSVFHTVAGAPYSALKLRDDEVTGPLDIVNVTAVGTSAGSTGIENGAGGPVTVVNTIARGGTNDFTLGAVVQNTLVSYSNFRPLASSGVTLGSGNQSTAPLFAGPSDFHPAIESETIDAGNPSVTLGPDPDGTTRGTAPDIGAFEHLAAGGGGDGGDGGTGGPGAAGTTTGGSTVTTTTTDTSGKTGDPATGSGTDTSGAGSGDADLPTSASPVLGQSVGLGPVKGSVTVQLPGTTGPVALDQGASVPVGSIIDATNGTVALTSVRDKSGKLQTGQFWGGTFRVGQSRRDAYTELSLVGAGPSCRTRDRVSAAARRRARRLWGRDRGGRFRTRGRHGSATVRGTEWLTEDRCGGTFFRVKNGKIVVRDAGKRKNVKLGRGGSYLARSR